MERLTEKYPTPTRANGLRNLVSRLIKLSEAWNNFRDSRDGGVSGGAPSLVHEVSIGRGTRMDHGSGHGRGSTDR